ncbi:hypothetical protein Tco_0225638, partial [Tanacetum coccineum]
KPYTFNGTKGVVGLRRWIEKVEQVFEACKCAEEDNVMFAASIFEGRALTWWNGNVHTLGLVNANRIPWTEVGESQLIGPELVQETTEKIFQIKERLKKARSRQKSYADKRRKPLEFKVGDRVLLKVSP